MSYLINEARNIFLLQPQSLKLKGISSQSRHFLPSELIVNTWFPQTQEQTVREKPKSSNNNLRLGQESFILWEDYAWEEYLAWLSSDQGRAQPAIIHKYKESIVGMQ